MTAEVCRGVIEANLRIVDPVQYRKRLDDQ
jgi:hypothetical protein